MRNCASSGFEPAAVRSGGFSIGTIKHALLADPTSARAGHIGSLPFRGLVPSVMQEMVADGHSFAAAYVDFQSRLLKPAELAAATASECPASSITILLGDEIARL